MGCQYLTTNARTLSNIDHCHDFEPSYAIVVKDLQGGLFFPMFERPRFAILWLRRSQDVHGWRPLFAVTSKKFFAGPILLYESQANHRPPIHRDMGSITSGRHLSSDLILQPRSASFTATKVPSPKTHPVIRHREGTVSEDLP